MGRAKRLFNEDRVVAYSAKTRRGGDEILRIIERALADFRA
jgi:hypothetical protein